MGNYLTICVLGLKRCRQLLAEHNENLVAPSFELKPVIPKGFMREMLGADHKKYRSILMRGIQPGAMETHREFHRTIIAETLEDYVSNQNNEPTAQQYIDAMDTIGQSIMLHIFFGAEYGTNYHNQLTDIYRKMWDKVWHFYLGDKQLEALEELKTLLLNTLKDTSNSKQSGVSESILGRIHDSGSLDETMLVNLIYMVETGRFAVYSLMRWVTKYAVDNSEFFVRISNDSNTFSNEKDCIAQAFVQESLRLNQIDRLQRHVTKSFVFEGFLFPKGSLARLCLWESHKSPEVFSDPFTFNPQRFLDNQFSLDEFAPFGVGSHRCPLGALSIQICRLYLHYLSSNFKLEAIGNGPPLRGIAHYEPAKEFTVLLHKK
ncbi:MAG: cytochrome P450 [Verrucomicrobia bacterium]|nr:cytochrome P450 [Verrucomicrobiota bacterium]